jgi:hypothetical protein
VYCVIWWVSPDEPGREEGRGGIPAAENLVLQSRLDPLSSSHFQRVLQQRSVLPLPGWPTDRGTPLRADPSSTLPIQDIAAGFFKQDLHRAGPKVPVRGCVGAWLARTVGPGWLLDDDGSQRALRLFERHRRRMATKP